jgi:hypothetical protein
MAKDINKNQFLTDLSNIYADTAVNHLNLDSTINLNSNSNLFKNRQTNTVNDKDADMKDSFRVLHQNIRGLKSKLNEFELSIVEVAPHTALLNTISTTTKLTLHTYQIIN